MSDANKFKFLLPKVTSNTVIFINIASLNIWTDKEPKGSLHVHAVGRGDEVAILKADGSFYFFTRSWAD